MENTAIELYSKIQNPIEAINQLGDFFARSGMFGCDNSGSQASLAQGKVLATACLTERKSPIQIIREYHIINGRLSDRADSMLAKFRGKGGKHRVISQDSECAEVELEYEGQKLRSRFTWEEAQGEPFVWKDESKRIPKRNWATPRARMQTLWARVISHGVRTLAPEIVAGIYTPEEVQDVTIEATTAPLLPEQPKAVDVEVVKVEPDQQVTVKNVEPPQPAQTDQSADSQKLDRTLQEKVLFAIGPENLSAATLWCRAKGKIPADGDMTLLSEKDANDILAYTPQFLKRIKEDTAQG